MPSKVTVKEEITAAVDEIEALVAEPDAKPVREVVIVTVLAVPAARPLTVIKPVPEIPTPPAALFVPVQV